MADSYVPRAGRAIGLGRSIVVRFALARLLRPFPVRSIAIQLPEAIHDTTGRFEGSE